jgi:hypothetical protein
MPPLLPPAIPRANLIVARSGLSSSQTHQSVSSRCETSPSISRKTSSILEFLLHMSVLHLLPSKSFLLWPRKLELSVSLSRTYWSISRTTSSYRSMSYSAERRRISYWSDIVLRILNSLGFNLMIQLLDTWGLREVRLSRLYGEVRLLVDMRVTDFAFERRLM